MSQQPESSSEARPSPAATFPFPAVAPAAQGPETVINPERRGLTANGSPTPLHPPNSGVWQRLFPSENDLAAGTVEPPAGFELEHFVIEERIGAGGMGAVFRAVDQRLQRVVALKVLAPFQSTDISSVQRFQNEARAAARLDHDNIARVYYVGEDKGLQFIAFEYVTGTNVRDLIRRQGTLAPGEAVNYTLQIAAALRHTVLAGVVHRDIKPSNIIITPNGRAKLVDLGLARKQNSESVGELTMAGTTLGTFDYISPEQAKDPRNVDVRSDIYSLGCTLYHMLAGEPPYPEGTVLQKLLDHQGKDPPDPAKKNRRVPPALTAIVQKMMASDPRRRYGTPDELIRDLMFVAGALGLRGVNPEGLVWSSSRLPGASFLERYGGWIATLAALLLVVVLIDRVPLPGQPRGTPVAANTASDDDGTTLAGSGRSPPATASADPIAAAASDSGSTLLDEGGATAPGSTGTDVSNPLASLLQHDHPAGSAKGPLFPDESPLLGNFPLVPPGEVFADRGGTPLIEPPDSMGTEIPSAAPGATSTETSRGPAAPAVAVKPATTPATAAEPSPPSTAPPFPPMVMDTPAISLINGDERKTYPTLEAACAQAADNGVIELSYNGSRGETERPLRIANKRVIIRAARGYRPLIEFDPKPVPAQAAETHMITVENGQVDLINVDVQVRVREEVELRADQNWSLFLLQGFESELVRLEGTTVTFVNPAEHPAAVFELAAGAGRMLSNMKMMMGEDAVRSRFTVDVVESLVRGGTDLFHVRHALPGTLTVERSALALEGTLLRNSGDLDSPAERAQLILQMNYVTAVVDQGMARIETGDLPRKTLPLSVWVRNSIFASRSGAPLVRMRGTTNPDDFRESLRWTGENNCYDGFETFWTIASPQSPEPIESLDFAEWKSAWSSSSDTAERNAKATGVAWAGQWADRPSAAIVPADLELDRSVADNPAVASATDGTSDVGAPLHRLPTFIPSE